LVTTMRVWVEQIVVLLIVATIVAAIWLLLVYGYIDAANFALSFVSWFVALLVAEGIKKLVEKITARKD